MKYILECGEPKLTDTNVKFYEGDCLQGVFTKECIKDYAADEVYKDGFEHGKREGSQDAQKIYKAVADIPTPVRTVIFGEYSLENIIKNFSIHEIKEEVEKYNADIKVGDEVESTTGMRAVVTQVGENDVSAINYSGTSFRIRTKSIYKTGRHFDEIENLFLKMKDALKMK